MSPGRGTVVVLVIGVLLIVPHVGAAQKRIHGFIEPMPTAKLKQLFPRAASFAPRGDEDPPRFTAYAVNPPGPPARPIGYAFWTIDVLPGMLGYDGHIHMLIGFDTAARLTGVIMDMNNEPYGFSRSIVHRLRRSSRARASAIRLCMDGMSTPSRGQPSLSDPRR